MANIRNNTMSPAAARPGESMQTVRDRWAGEVNPTGGMDQDPPWTAADTRFGMPGQMDQGNQMMSQMDQRNQMMDQMMGQNTLQMSRSGRSPQSGGLSMRNDLPSEVVESPTTLNEAYLGSLKATLGRNKGNFIVATFLIGTQNLMTWEGILYEVGNDYVTIYQPARDRYVVIDMYSLKYMEFYDTRQRELCNRLLQEQGLQNGW